MKKIIIIVSLLLLFAGGFIVWNRSRTEEQSKTSATVRRGQITQSITLSGKIQAKEQYTLRFQTTGQLAGVYKKEGDTVKKYELLAALDQRKLQKELQQLLNTYASTRLTFEQTKSDNEKTAQLASEQAVRDRAKRLIDQSQFSLNNSVLAVEAQSLAIQFASLYSPIEGIITKAPILAPGIYITAPSQAEFEIVNPASLYFEALADQTEIGALREGSAVTITIDAFPDKTIQGKLSAIAFSPKDGEVGTVYPVTISLHNAPLEQFRLGMTGDATIIIESKDNALLLPLSAVDSREGKKYVRVKENSAIVEKEIITGLENDTDAEIVSGISEGTIVYD